MNDNLPVLISRWVSELLEGEIPAETAACCHACAMVPGDGAIAPGQVYFRKETKCCTYLPSLPNFLVGCILKDLDPAASPGRSSVEERIDRGLAVTPLGLLQDRRFMTLYNDSREAFGQNHTLRCPHLLASGQCGIWRHRESTCATWFCKHNRGATGLAFWEKLHQLMANVEHSLAIWCLLELGFKAQSLELILGSSIQASSKQGVSAKELDQESDPSFQRAVWGEWYGSEREFYRNCGSLVRDLDWQKVSSICGPATAARAQIVRNQYQELLVPTLPDRVTIGNCKLVRISNNEAVVTAYSKLDPVKMNRTLYEALSFFCGESIESARRELLASRRVDISLSLVRRLLDYQILVEAPNNGQ